MPEKSASGKSVNGLLFYSSAFELGAPASMDHGVLARRPRLFVSIRRQTQGHVAVAVVCRKLLKKMWWRPRGSNPFPKMLLVKGLHACSHSGPGITDETRANLVAFHGVVVRCATTRLKYVS